MKISLPACLWKVVAFYFAITAMAYAADFTVVNVGMSAFQFNGTSNNPTLTLTRGSTYTFAVSSPGHPFDIKTNSSTGSGNRYNNGVVNQGVTSATLTFAIPLDAPTPLQYNCEVHTAMHGVINLVNPANFPPTVNITSPANGTVFAAPANITIQAMATDDGSVTNVEFRVGSTSLTNDTVAPYTAVTNLPAGAYALTAIAFDNLGVTSTNSVNIIVDALPGISITNPAAGAAFRAPANLVLYASVSDSDGTVTNVQFFSTATSLGNVTNNIAAGSFMFTNINLSAGNYAFSAVARDNFGGATTSAAVNVFLLTNSAVGAPSHFANGQTVFTLSGTAGQSYTTEASSNLFNWVPLFTNTAPANVFNITDFTSTNALPRFYRTRQDF